MKGGLGLVWVSAKAGEWWAALPRPSKRWRDAPQHGAGEQLGYEVMGLRAKLCHGASSLRTAALKAGHSVTRGPKKARALT